MFWPEDLGLGVGASACSVSQLVAIIQSKSGGSRVWGLGSRTRACDFGGFESWDRTARPIAWSRVLIRHPV